MLIHIGTISGHVTITILTEISPDFPGKSGKPWKRRFLKASTTWPPTFRRFQGLGVYAYKQASLSANYLARIKTLNNALSLKPYAQKGVNKMNGILRRKFLRKQTSVAVLISRSLVGLWRPWHSGKKYLKSGIFIFENNPSKRCFWRMINHYRLFFIFFNFLKIPLFGYFTPLWAFEGRGSASTFRLQSQCSCKVKRGPF